MDKATEQLYREREKRYIDAVQLRIPDRVPTSVHLSYFPARFTGITYQGLLLRFSEMERGLHQDRPLACSRTGANISQPVRQGHGSAGCKNLRLAGARSRRQLLPSVCGRRIHEGGGV